MQCYSFAILLNAIRHNLSIHSSMKDNNKTTVFRYLKIQHHTKINTQKYCHAISLKRQMIVFSPMIIKFMLCLLHWWRIDEKWNEMISTCHVNSHEICNYVVVVVYTKDDMESPTVLASHEYSMCALAHVCECLKCDTI
jgi:hypothetical protein